MAAVEDESPFGTTRPKPALHVVGQSVDDLSARELLERIDALKLEIHRLEGAIREREATKQAASSIFRI